MKTFRIAAIVLLIAMPLAAFAQTTSGTSESSLVAELTALEQEISALTGSSSTTPVTAPTTTSSNQSVVTGLCPDLSRTLSIGQSGADVIGLQEFLASQGMFHAEVTGYFGTVTQSAVQTWQADNNIVSSGSPSTTGYGVVGPRTSAAMESLCDGAQTTNTVSGITTTHTSVQCQQTLPPSTECPTSWQPVLDSNGCTEYYQCSISLPTGSSATSATSTTTTTTNACPVAQQPTCSGTVQSFTTSNGCQAYECVL